MYPIHFDKCPVCGSARRIVEEEANLEIEAGHLDKGTRIPAVIIQSALFNPNSQKKLIVRRPVVIMMGFADVCADCGTLYCVEMQKGTGIMEPQVKRGMPPAGPGFSTS